MKLSTSVESIMGGIFVCTRCHVCTYGPEPEHHTFCPLYERDRTFTASAGGLLNLAKAIISKRFDYNEDLAELAYTCTACGACDKCRIVPSINPMMATSDIIRLIRYELVRRGLVPPGPIKKMVEALEENGDLPGKTVDIPEIIRDDNAKTLLIAECIHTDTEAASFGAALELLEKMGSRVALFTDPGCCGSTLYDFGFWDQMIPLVESKWKQIDKLGQKELLFVNPHCQEFMTNKYRKITDDFSGFDGRHFTEWVLDALRKGDLQSKKSDKITVTYHDPCFLGRGLGIFEPPRQVLAELEGVEIIEMKRNREQSVCCGARGLGNYFEEFAIGTAKTRVREFLDTGADTLITACTYCTDIFRKALGGEAERVQNLTGFVRDRVE